MQAKTQAPPKNPWLSVQTFVLVVKFHSICRATEEYGTNHSIWNQFVLQSEYKWLALLGELLIWTQNISTTWTCLTSIFLSFWEPPFIKKNMYFSESSHFLYCFKKCYRGISSFSPMLKGEQKKNLPKFFYNNSVKFYSHSKILDIFE